ncbi:hypothetical protein OAN22_02610 [Alphaproteobacteria bacterium]|nr:hypothetical protein [Alphaproteobacteria bacterium]
MNLTVGMSTADSGRKAKSQVIGTIADNVSNVNTKGHQQTIRTLQSQEAGGRGAGVRANTAERVVDDLAIKRLWTAQSSFSYATAKTENIESLSSILGQTGDENITLHGRMTTLAEQMSKLSANANDPKFIEGTVAAAKRLTDEMHSLTKRIQDIRIHVDEEINVGINRVNAKIARIDELNEDITFNASRNQETASLESQRDAAMRDLAEDMEIQRLTVGLTKNYRVYTPSGQALLLDKPATITFFQTSSFSPGSTGNGITINGSDATTTLLASKKGRLSGLLEVRDDVMVKFQEQLDQLAETLRDQLNNLHNEGTPYPPTTSLTGTRTFSGDPATELDFQNGSGLVHFVRMDNSTGASNTGDATISKYRVRNTIAVDLGAMTYSVDGGAAAAIGGTSLQSFVDAMNTQTPTTGLTFAINPTSKSLSITAATNAYVGVVQDKDTPGKVEIMDTNSGLNTPNQGFSHLFGLNDFFQTPGTHAGDSKTGLSETLVVKPEIVSNPRLLSRGKIIQPNTFAAGTVSGFTIGNAGINDHTGDIALKMEKGIRVDTYSMPTSGFRTAVTESLLHYTAGFFESTTVQHQEAEDAKEKTEVGLHAIEDVNDEISAVDLMDQLTNLTVFQNSMTADLWVLKVLGALLTETINIV